MKLWQKDKDSLSDVSRFTVGNDGLLDLYLAKFDILGSIALIVMLESAGLLTADELAELRRELRRIYETVGEGSFHIEDGVEDVHSQIEILLTRALGDVGKKIHSGRSRNDQVLVDVKLFLRDEIMSLTDSIQVLFK